MELRSKKVDLTEVKGVSLSHKEKLNDSESEIFRNSSKRVNRSSRRLYNPSTLTTSSSHLSVDPYNYTLQHEMGFKSLVKKTLKTLSSQSLNQTELAVANKYKSSMISGSNLSTPTLTYDYSLLKSQQLPILVKGASNLSPVSVERRVLKPVKLIEKKDKESKTMRTGFSLDDNDTGQKDHRKISTPKTHKRRKHTTNEFTTEFVEGVFKRIVNMKGNKKTINTTRNLSPSKKTSSDIFLTPSKWDKPSISLSLPSSPEVSSATKANSSATKANSSATKTNSSATKTNSSATKTNSSATKANSSATKANSSATKANSSATKANSSATKANSSATKANSSATKANSSATKANSSVTKVNSSPYSVPSRKYPQSLKNIPVVALNDCNEMLKGTRAVPLSISSSIRSQSATVKVSPVPEEQVFIYNKSKTLSPFKTPSPLSEDETMSKIIEKFHKSTSESRNTSTSKKSVPDYSNKANITAAKGIGSLQARSESVDKLLNSSSDSVDDESQVTLKAKVIVQKQKRSKNANDNSYLKELHRATRQLLNLSTTGKRLKKDVIQFAEKSSEMFLDQMMNDVITFAKHAGRQTVQKEDFILLMKRQGIINEAKCFEDLVLENMPSDCFPKLCPCAIAYNDILH